jgi:hypothetical protein
MKNRLWLIVLSALALCAGSVHAGKGKPRREWTKLDLSSTPPAVQQMSRDSEKADKAPAQQSLVTFNPFVDKVDEPAAVVIDWPGVASAASLEVPAEDLQTPPFEADDFVEIAEQPYTQVLAEITGDTKLKSVPQAPVTSPVHHVRHEQVMAQLIKNATSQSSEVAELSDSSVTVEDRKSALPQLHVLKVNTDALEAAAKAAIAAEKVAVSESTAAPLAGEAAVEVQAAEVAVAPVVQPEATSFWWNPFSWGSSASAAPADVLKQIAADASKAQEVQVSVPVSVESVVQPAKEEAAQSAPAVAQVAQSVPVEEIKPVVEIKSEAPGFVWNTARLTRFSRVIGGLQELQGKVVDPQTRGYFATTKGRHATAHELEERRNQLMAILVAQGAPQFASMITTAKANLKTEQAKRDATILEETDLIMCAVDKKHVRLNPEDLLQIHQELKKTNDALRQRFNVESLALVTALGECVAQYFEQEAQLIGKVKKVQRQAHLNCAALSQNTGNESDDEGAMQKTRDPIELFAELAISQPVKVGAFTILIQRSTDTEERP